MLSPSNPGHEVPHTSTSSTSAILTRTCGPADGACLTTVRALDDGRSPAASANANANGQAAGACRDAAPARARGQLQTREAAARGAHGRDPSFSSLPRSARCPRDCGVLGRMVHAESVALQREQSMTELIVELDTPRRAHQLPARAANPAMLRSARRSGGPAIAVSSAILSSAEVATSLSGTRCPWSS